MTFFYFDRQVIPLDGLKSTIAIDWCSISNSIYWTDVGRSAISRSYLNGSDQEHILTANLVSPAGLALDWITNKLYWTDTGTNRIEVATTDGKHRALLIWKRLGKPRDIVVDPLGTFHSHNSHRSCSKIHFAQIHLQMD